ncbi:PREDICTED: phospho-N-acetylmuramoyl-pentapeptide-transferase homolog isoform X2 [Nelumbo nucifera]|uniref:Phospho-N-acetylmuramoyl-pentapeptide- transferase homolog n=2 Tax=Nelumbo nucifera TaxID=4432 RepID=A0A822YXX6_NELNU|nr:PREDICTED: phospho-N-acetylmuramoyl-pentapeptide-transferase homolog isoform X2 [Nelumbo nucifera]DAD37522.1 TPA_asm: hypothetical protein HUJ06_008163 [Nelumbo nucifera]
MRSPAALRFSRLGFLQTSKRSFTSRTGTQAIFASLCCHHRFAYNFNLCASKAQRHGFKLRHDLFPIEAMDEDSVGISSFNDWDYGESDGTSGRSSYILSSSDGEDSDADIIINTTTKDADLPGSIKEHMDSSDGPLTVTADRLGVLRKGRKLRIQPGVFMNMALIAFLVVLLLLVDWCSWRIVRLPLESFFLTRPFIISAVLTSVAGYLCIPVLYSLKVHQILRKEGPVAHSSKKRTPTMGGLFFVPIGIIVARAIAGFSSVEVAGAATATLAFAAIGLLDDILSFIKNHNYGLPAWVKVFLEVAVGVWFSLWLGSANISSPYSMKMLVPLPAPLGLLYLGELLYLLLTTFCFVSMGNGINLTDGLDGLAGDLAIFGSSMAGACVGFLLHNRYKASVFMGDTGSLALGGALAAMTACTGMFFPLFISSGIFVLEAVSVIVQVFYFKTTKYLHGSGRRLFRMAPLHHHFELCGYKEPEIVACAYVVSCILAVFAGYIGLISS